MDSYDLLTEYHKDSMVRPFLLLSEFMSIPGREYQQWPFQSRAQKVLWYQAYLQRHLVKIR